MGVPALFRWLSSKYPNIVSNVKEEQSQWVDGVEIPVDISKQNPNGMEFDNLYLDMNGIIHPCCHPEDKPAPDTEDDMITEIFKYTERMINMVRPRRVVYLAIDGVAPRAKMNQQRSRRFRASLELQQKEEEKRKQLAELKEQNPDFKDLDEGEVEGLAFDSNCITPGTPFMTRLSRCLKHWLACKMNEDPNWANIKVILSDSSVPGEGEHKIMDYIRQQRSSQEYDPNTRHVIYGLDADLIMLALATHEPHFNVLREDVFFGEASKTACFICKQEGHRADQCTGKKEKLEKKDANGNALLKPFVFLHVNILRDYLEVELKCPNVSFDYDFERAIDDWVFLCYFVGNDFLPHLPSLEIREGALDTLTDIWKRLLPTMGDFLTNQGNVNLNPLKLLVTELGNQEDLVFQQRHQREVSRNRNQKRRRLNQPQAPRPPQQPLMSASSMKNVPFQSAERASNQAAAKFLKGLMNETKGNNLGFLLNTPLPDAPAPEHTPTAPMEIETPSQNKRPAETPAEVIAEPVDNIKLWESGWKERYYRQKFGVELSDLEFRKKIVKSYIEGLCWVLKYYYLGCPSWKWFFPFHYAPFASDLGEFLTENMEIDFEMGAPLRPYEQLMSVLPAASRTHIPAAFQELMTKQDSEIIDFYPEEFELDLNGKRYTWQGVAILPFIDENRLLNALTPKYAELTPEEVFRNTQGNEILFISRSNKLYKKCFFLYATGSTEEEVRLDPKFTMGMMGTVKRDPECVPNAPLTSPLKGLPDVDSNQCLSLFYRNPAVPTLVGGLLKGVRLPKKSSNFATPPRHQQPMNQRKYPNNPSNPNVGWGKGYYNLSDRSQGQTGMTRTASEPVFHLNYRNYQVPNLKRAKEDESKKFR